MIINQKCRHVQKDPFYVITYHKASEETLGMLGLVAQCQNGLRVLDSPRCWFCRGVRALEKENLI